MVEHQCQPQPDISAEQHASNELIKLIRKLRWIGMEDEARTLQRSLRSLRVTDSVLAIPTDTD